jgi:RPA family protein
MADIDTSSEAWRVECWNRHLARVEKLKAAKTQEEQVAIFRAIKQEADKYSAREAWSAAFPKEKK